MSFDAGSSFDGCEFLPGLCRSLGSLGGLNQYNVAPTDVLHDTVDDRDCHLLSIRVPPASKQILWACALLVGLKSGSARPEQSRDYWV